MNSVHKLKADGVTDLHALMNFSAADLRARGVRRDFAQQLLGFLRRRQTQHVPQRRP